MQPFAFPGCGRVGERRFGQAQPKLEPKWPRSQTGVTSTPDTKHQQQYHSSSLLLAAVLLCGRCLYHAPYPTALGHGGNIVTITGTGVLTFCRMQLARFSDDEHSSCKPKFEVPPAAGDPSCSALRRAVTSVNHVEQMLRQGVEGSMLSISLI